MVLKYQPSVRSVLMCDFRGNGCSGNSQGQASGSRVQKQTQQSIGNSGTNKHY